MSIHYQTLISIEQLQALLNEQAPLLLLDIGFDLADTGAGERAYAQAHLPGAHYLHLDRDLCGAKTGADGVFRGRHPLPVRGAFAERMAALGLTPQTQVVCYDAQGGMFAARAWWMLRWLGHANVAVLDGGLPTWHAAGGALTAELPPAPVASGFQAGEALVRTIEADELLAALGRVRLIDARAEERFRGEVEPLDAQAGHIPGASNRNFKRNLDADGRFKPLELLHAEFSSLLAPYGADKVVHQCGSGVTACHNLLAMAHAGLGFGTLYPGSWSEWSGDPRRPLAKA